MSVTVNAIGKWAKAGVAAIGLGAVALPVMGAFATPVDPTQQVEEETVAEDVVAGEAVAPLTEEQMAASAGLFNQYSCGACHVLGAAGGNGHIGPQLDGNSKIDAGYIVNIVSNGQGAMPSFGGMMDEAQIEQLASYIIQVKK